jgi:hypothetical protein
MAKPESHDLAFDVISRVRSKQQYNFIVHICVEQLFPSNYCFFYYYNGNIHESQVGEVLPYKFERDEGANASNFKFQRLT